MKVRRYLGQFFPSSFNPLLRVVSFPVSPFSFLLFSLFLSSCSSHPYADGERLYLTNCANCHLDDGKGLGALIPPLAGSDHLTGQAERLPCIIRYGLRDTIVVNGKTYAEVMPGVPALSEVDVVNLTNYVLNRWAPGHPLYSPEQVRRQLERCSK